MNFPGDLLFLRPWWFAALLPLAGLLWLLVYRRASDRSWERVCDLWLLPFMLLGQDMNVRRRGFIFLTGLAGALAIIALAGPAWERLPQPVARDDAALVVVFDLSLSMRAVDIKPDRLSQARFKVSDLLARRERGQTGLVVYARNAFTVVPVTDDNAAIELYLQSLDTNLMPNQGSRADLGLQEAFSLLQRVKAERGDVLLITDYADTRVIEQARKLGGKEYEVSVMGIGTEAGGPVFLSSGDFLSHAGEVVVPQFADGVLREVAQAGGGVYVRFDAFGNSDVQRLTQWLESRESPGLGTGDRKATADKWREEGPWLLLLLLPILLPGFRRGVLAVAVCAALMQPGPAYALDWALDWDSLWLRSDQQAERALQKGEADRAAELFDDRKWKAVAQHRSGDFAGAVETLEPFDGAADWYNRGNSLVGAGKLQEAIEAYRHALEMNPGLEDAGYNMAMVREFIKQMPAQEAQQGDGEEGEKSDAQSSADGENQQGQQQDDDNGQTPEGEDEQDLAEGDDGSGDRDEDGEDEGSEEREGKSEDGEDGDAVDNASLPETLTERDQAIEQWLRGVNESPGRLLKRKLKQLSRKKKNPLGSGEKPW